MTSALDLLSEAHRVLREQVAPGLDGEARLAVLLAANAVATARRELALGARLTAAEAELLPDASAIRHGARDDDGATYARLMTVAVLRAHVADPSILTERERRTWIEEEQQ